MLRQVAAISRLKLTWHLSLYKEAVRLGFLPIGKVYSCLSSPFQPSVGICSFYKDLNSNIFLEVFLWPIKLATRSNCFWCHRFLESSQLHSHRPASFSPGRYWDHSWGVTGDAEDQVGELGSSPAATTVRPPVLGLVFPIVKKEGWTI